jgi:type II secretory pathway pseudopilin PulG
MMNSNQRRALDSESGVSVIDILVAIALFAILSCLALPNIQFSKQQAFNSTAFNDYQNLKSALNADRSIHEQLPDFALFNISSAITFPDKLKLVELSRSVTLDYAIKRNITLKKLQTPSTQISFLIFQIRHSMGNRIYRYFKLGGIVLEQEIEA